MQIFKQEGIRGFYRGLSASYLGVAESALHLVLYERIKEISQSSVDIPQKVSDCELPSQHTPWYRILSYLGIGGSAGIAKLIAGAIAYPHEVSNAQLVFTAHQLTDRCYRLYGHVYVKLHCPMESSNTRR